MSHGTGVDRRIEYAQVVVAMQFCPTCGNHVVLGRGSEDNNRFYCRTCPYVFDIRPNWHLYEQRQVERKEVDDVLGGSEAWAGNQQADLACPRAGCESDRAYYMQMQIRSADEPMTTFYKCVKCGHVSRED